ncbi:MAG: type IV secretory system conjugative DNA transfer family protein, partial [Holdemanella sp.]|nr:type IV secretory system conjugative DNA transfer family protein [Holdemanella sp.]
MLNNKFFSIKTKDEQNVRDVSNKGNNIVIHQLTCLKDEIRLNDNVFVVGGSGSGKTRFFVKPNILQMYGNYIVVDPKGSVAEETGNAFRENGYEVRYLNLVDMDKSMGYNPFDYFNSPEDIQRFVKNLIDNTKGENPNGVDGDFWVKAEQTWISAMIFYIVATCRGTEMCNMNTVMLLLDNSSNREDNEDYKSAVDFMFEDLENEIRVRNNGRSKYSYEDLAVRNYRIYKQAAGNTAKGILVSVGARLQILNTPGLQRILEKDELHLDHLGNPMVRSLNEAKKDNLSFDIDRKTYEIVQPKADYEKLDTERLRKVILFIIISDSDGTYSFLASILLQQLYTELYFIADKRKDHKLPIHTRFINDEFANCGRQPDFQRKISTMRSREISTAIIVQGISQIKSRSLYGDDWEAIYENCAITLFLGSKGPTTLNEISKLGGKQTIAIKTESETKGTTTSVTRGEQYSTRDLYDYGELGRLALNKCLVHISGYNVFEDFKYDVKDHPNVHLTEDADKDGEKNHFDIVEWIAQMQAIDESRGVTARASIKLSEASVDVDEY